MRSVLFVERDDALIQPPPGSNLSLRRLLPAPDVMPALRRLTAAGYTIVVLDPPGDDRDDIEQRNADNAFLVELLSSQGVQVEQLAGCSHPPAAKCDCAFPGPGLLRDYLAETTLDRKRSAVVGGGTSAEQLAGNLGLRSFTLDPGASRAWTSVAHTLLDAPRQATVERRTRETAITIRVDLDAPNDPEISTGIGFFDHMLEQLGKHGGFGLSIECTGDLQVDEHHTVEDVALALGEALRKALGSKLGIARYGFLLPMDEARVQVALDLSGRPWFVFEGTFNRENVGGLPTELVPHFFRSLSDALAATLHLSVQGENDHHMIEACFKGLARALRQAIQRSGQELPSTKGAL